MSFISAFIQSARSARSANCGTVFSRSSRFSFVAIACALLMPAVASAQSIFYFKNIGAGTTGTYTAPVDTIRVNSAGPRAISLSVEKGGVPSYSNYYSLDFNVPEGQTLQLGAYEGATRAAFASASPGLNISGSGWGCNRPSGRFAILDLAFLPDGTLSRFAANFVQYCEGGPYPLFGEIRFNSAIPISPAVVDTDVSPDPFAVVMRGPVDPGTYVTSLPTMAYGINAPTPISVVNGAYSINGGTFTTAVGNVQNGDQIVVRVLSSVVPGGTVTSTLNIGDRSASATVTTYGPGMQLTGIRVSSTPGDYIGGGQQRLYLSPYDRFTSSSNFSNGVQVQLNGQNGEWLTLNLAGPNNAPLAVGTYENAKRWPFHDASPGIDFSGNGSGCNQILGRFVIREFATKADGTLDRLAADFEQRCEVAGPPLSGEVRINSAIPFTSLPTDVRYGVAVKKVGRGQGVVTGLGGEFSCGAVCLVYLPQGWSLSATATAESGSVFKGWEDSSYLANCSGTGVCSLQVTGGRVLTARFEKPTKLTVQPSGTGDGSIFSYPGGISCNASTACDYDFDLDTVVTLSASPRYGSVFTGWNGGGCSGTSTCTVTMDQAKTVQANFTAGFVLSVAKDQAYGSGKVTSSPAAIDCGFQCTGLLPRNATVTLTATPDAGSRFVSWSGSCTGTQPTCTIEMNQTTAITAIFANVPNRLTVTKAGSGAGTVSSTNGTINCGTTCEANVSLQLGVQLTATPAAGSVFAGWSGGGCSGNGVCNVTATSDVNITAIFNKGRNTPSKVTDTSGDGRSDLVFRNSTTGEIAGWLMNGTTLTSGASLLNAGTGWTVTHMADFDGDGKADIMFRNDDGTVVIWTMNGLTATSGAGIISANNTWRVAHVADFNGDGKADILWRNQIDGSGAIWLMNGTTLISGTAVIGPGPWVAAVTGDFNGDGKADIVWRNSIDGSTALWLMNGTTFISGAGLIGAGPWVPTHTADFDGDGNADIIWRNSTDGSSALWLMNGTTFISGAGLVGAGSWTVSQVADFNGDGKADILWRNSSDTSHAMWLMNGTAITSGAGLFGPSAYVAAQIGDYNGDGRADIIWRNTADGSLAMWLMNGTTITSGAALIGAGPWQTVP
jgi:hypothetical protein